MTSEKTRRMYHLRKVAVRTTILAIAAITGMLISAVLLSIFVPV